MMDENKPNTGEITFHNEDKTIFVKYMMVNGVPHGHSVVYKNNDEIIQRVNFKEGKLDGEMIIYENSKMKMKLNFKNNLQHGDAVYYDKDEKIIGTERYAAGLKEGTSEWKDEKGNLLFTANYEKNKLHGEKLEYYPNGKVKKRYLFNNGELTAAPEEYFKNGWKKRKVF